MYIYVCLPTFRFELKPIAVCGPLQADSHSADKSFGHFPNAQKDYAKYPLIFFVAIYKGGIEKSFSLQFYFQKCVNRGEQLDAAPAYELPVT